MDVLPALMTRLLTMFEAGKARLEQVRADAPGATGTRRRIAVVEDNADNRLPVEAILDESPPGPRTTWIFLDTGFEAPASARACRRRRACSGPTRRSGQPIAPAEGFITTDSTLLEEPVTPLEIDMADNLGGALGEPQLMKANTIADLESAIAKQAAATTPMLDGLVLDTSAEA